MNIPSRILFFLIAIIAAVGLIAAEAPRIVIYEEPDQGGELFTLSKKIEDLLNYRNLLDKAQSFCAIGQWHFFSATNWTGSIQAFYGSGDAHEEGNCDNFNFSAAGKFNSARYTGASDTRTPAIAIYEEAWKGQEVVVTGPAKTNFPFTTPKILSVHGSSNWTVFTGNNFEGDSWCATTQGKLYDFYELNPTFPALSVVRGCDSSLPLGIPADHHELEHFVRS